MFKKTNLTTGDILFKSTDFNAINNVESFVSPLTPLLIIRHLLEKRVNVHCMLQIFPVAKSAHLLKHFLHVLFFPQFVFFCFFFFFKVTKF